MAEKEGAAAPGTDPASGDDVNKDTPTSGDEKPEDSTQVAGNKEETGEQNVFWRDLIKDEKMREQSERFDGPQALLEGLNKLQGEVSQRIKLLGDDPSDEDMAKYRKALNVPDTVDGYSYEPPEGVEWDDNAHSTLNAFSEIFHRNNIPAAAAQDIVNSYEAAAQAAYKTQEDDLQKYQDEASAELKRQWGKDYEANVNMITQVIESAGEDFKAFTGEVTAGGGRIGDNPAFMDFMAKYARSVSEHELTLGAYGDTAQTIKEQIETMEREKPPGSAASHDPAHQKKLRELYDKLYGSEPIAGSPA
jgi:hypothetical protein